MNRRTIVGAGVAVFSGAACGGLTERRPVSFFNHAAEGASLTNVARGGRSWTNHMVWGERATFQSLASNGASVVTMLARAAAFDGLFDDALPPGRNIAWFWCEAPEMHLDGSGDLAALKEHIATWIAGRNARGWRTVIKTVIPCGLSPGFELARQDVNVWLRSGASGADLLDDWAAIWPGDAASQPLLFEPDQIHISVGGAALGVRESSQPLCSQLSRE